MKMEMNEIRVRHGGNLACLASDVQRQVVRRPEWARDDWKSEGRNPNRSTDRWSAVSTTAQTAEAAQASGLRHSKPGGLRYKLLSEKLLNHVDDALDFFVRQFRIDRQAQAFARGLSSDWEIAFFVAER